MTMSNAKRLSVMALGLSMALAMLIGTASAKDGQAKDRKARARAKKARDGAKKDAPGAKPNRRRGGQAAQLKVVKAIVDDLVAELDLNEDQKAKVERIVKKHLRTLAAAKGRGQDKDKAPGDPKKPRGKKGGKKKGQGAAKGNNGPEIDRF